MCIKRRMGVENYDGQAPMVSATSNMVMSCLGVGQLTLPYALRQMGFACGISVLVACTLLSMYSCRLLSIASKKTGQKCYAGILETLLGKWAQKLTSVLIAFYAWGGGIAFLLIIKSQAGLLRDALMSTTGMLSLNPSNTTLLFAVVALIIWPLSLLVCLDKLKFTSLLGCACAILITVVVVLALPREGTSGLEICGGDDGKFHTGPASFLAFGAAVPLMAFALNSSWAFLNVHRTLREPTPKRSGGLISSANAIILLNYLVIGSAGYLSYCGDTRPNIMDNLEGGGSQVLSKLVLIARVALVFQLTFALPLRFVVARSAIGTLLNLNLNSLQHFGLSTAIVLSAAGLASTSLTLNVAIGITSAICASMIIYALPSVCDLVIVKDDVNAPYRRARIATDTFCVLLGIFVLLVGTYAILFLKPVSA